MTFEEYIKNYEHQVWSKVYSFLDVFNYPREDIFSPESVEVRRRETVRICSTSKEELLEDIQAFPDSTVFGETESGIVGYYSYFESEEDVQERLRIVTRLKKEYEEGVQARKAKEEDPEYHEYQLLKEKFEK